MQKYISAVTVSFLYILEPIFAAGIATLYLHEVLPPVGYIGGSLVVAGALIHTGGTVGQEAGQQRQEHAPFPVRQPGVVFRWDTAIYQLLCILAAAAILSGIGGFPPSSWQQMYRLEPVLLPLWQQGQRMFIALLVAQGFCWLLAWILLISMGCALVFRAVRSLVTPPADLPSMEYWNERGLR